MTDEELLEEILRAIVLHRHEKHTPPTYLVRDADVLSVIEGRIRQHLATPRDPDAQA